MKNIFATIILIAFFHNFVISQSLGFKITDSIVELAIINSEESLFKAKFEEAKNHLKLSYFESLPNCKPEHKILLTVQDIRINGFINVIYAKEPKHAENFERLKEMLPLLKDINDKKVLGRYLNTLSKLYRTMGHIDSFSLYQMKAISIFNQINDYEEIANIRAANISRKHQQLLQEKQKQGILDLIPLYKAEIDYSKIHSPYALSYNTRHLAQIHRKQTLNYKEALRLFQYSLDIRLMIGFKPFIPASYSSLGDVYMKLNQYENAINMYNKSSDLAEKIGFVRYQLYPNIQIGDHYAIKEQEDKAIEYYKKALKLSSKNNYSIGIDQALEKLKNLNQKY